MVLIIAIFLGTCNIFTFKAFACSYNILDMRKIQQYNPYDSYSILVLIAVIVLDALSQKREWILYLLGLKIINSYHQYLHRVTLADIYQKLDLTLHPFPVISYLQPSPGSARV